MNQTLHEQIQQLKKTIRDMEAQRSSLGDDVVEAALAPLEGKLIELIRMQKVQESPPASEPPMQRKLVTLLFMDIAGSTAIAQEMDPEDVRDLFDVTLKQLAQPVKDHGGHVTRFMGDGFLAVFGAPTAHEDDPEQAVRAGLGIIATSQELAPELKTDWGIPDFQVRVGINTGLVALGGLTEAEDTLMGAAVNLAARLENAAPAGSLLISHNTYRHVRGLFDVEPCEPVQAKGFDELVQVYRVLRVKPRAFRTYSRGVEGVETHMIGRDTELKYLQDALLTAIEEGEGQMVTVTGEAGVGKSRLLYEFQNWVDLHPQQIRFFEGRGRIESQNRPYGLLRDMFEFRFQIHDNERASTARQKLVAGLMDVFGNSQDSEMRSHILGQMLGYAFSQSPHLKGVRGDPEQLRNRGWKYLVEFFQELCIQNPVVIFMEDIHWADDSSLDLLGWLVGRMERLRMLIICAARPTLLERRPYWGEGLAFHHRLELSALSKRGSQELVSEILKHVDHLPNDVRDLLVENTEGNPFYLEELVKMLVEDGIIIKGEAHWSVHPERLGSINVPPTLAGVLQARLDSLPQEEKFVLQQASVVGRQFWDRAVAYIQASGEGDPRIVLSALTSLRARELVYRRENSSIRDSREFIFKHDILREVTYESVLKRLRKTYHSLVADWLIAQGAERIDEYSSLIAGHLLQAGRVNRAVGYFLHAGNSALEMYANAEAETNFRSALAFAPDDNARAAGLAGLGEALSRQGNSDLAEDTLRKAIDINTKLGRYDSVATLYAILSRVIWVNNYQQAWDVCQEGLRQLKGVQEGSGLARLLAEAGRTSYFLVKPADEIRTMCLRAIEIAERIDDFEIKADAMITLALLETYRNNDFQQSRAILEQVIELSEENGLPNITFRAYHNLGGSDFFNPAESSRMSKQAVKIGKQIRSNYLYGIGNLIETTISLGDLDNAEKLIGEIALVDASSESEKEWVSLMCYGRIKYARGEWSQAIEIQQNCVDLTRDRGSNARMANRNLELAISIIELDYFTDQGDLPEARRLLQNNIELGYREFESGCLLSIIFARSGQQEQAKDWLARTEDFLFKGGDYIDKVSKSDGEYELALTNGRWEDAVQTIEASIDFLKDHGFRWGWARRLIDLGNALTRRDGVGDREKAQEIYQQSLEMFKDMTAPGYVEVLENRLGNSA